MTKSRNSEMVSDYYKINGVCKRTLDVKGNPVSQTCNIINMQIDEAFKSKGI